MKNKSMWACMLFVCARTQAAELPSAGDILNQARSAGKTMDFVPPSPAYYPPVFPGGELMQCPPGAEEALSADPALGNQYLGFRYVRSDGSTCDYWPSGRISYQEPATQDITVQGSAASFAASLNSPQYRVRMDFYAMPTSDPGFAGPPFNGMRFFYVRQREYTGASLPAQVSLELANRAQNPIYPWQSETFRLSFDGAAVQAGVVSGAYQYSFQVTALQSPSGQQSFSVRAIPGARILTPPDAGGIKATLAKSADGRSFKILLNDQWASFYQGQKVEVSYQVKHERFLWFDDNIFSGDVALDAALQNVIDLSGQNPGKPLKGGDQYSVSFKFRRLGRMVSTDDWMPQQESAKIRF